MSVIPDHLNGAVIPGGCDTCNAEQTLTQQQPGMWSIGIAHDDWCPTWQRIQARRRPLPDTFKAAPPAFCDGCNGTATTAKGIKHDPWCSVT